MDVNKPKRKNLIKRIKLSIYRHKIIYGTVGCIVIIILVFLICIVNKQGVNILDQLWHT